MKKQLLSLLQIFTLTVSFAQSGDLMIKSGSKGFYIEHTVAPKEGLFPIGRLYNVHPRHIAAFNNLDFNKGLAIGQLINIPLTDTNFTQKGNKGVPVYYKTGGKETLLSVSNKNNKVPLNNVRTWNYLEKDDFPEGSKFIVGFLVTKEMRDRVVTIAERKKEVVLPPVEDKKPELVEVKKPEPEIKKEEPQVIKEEPKKQEPVFVKPVEKLPVVNGSYFKAHFDQQVKQWPLTKDQTVTSGIFKTTSGWEDHKYYLLVSGIEPGIIVKVTNPSNNKIVFAKVLYGMEGIRLNQGLDIRLSDAAAAALEVSETDKFIVKMNY